LLEGANRDRDKDHLAKPGLVLNRAAAGVVTRLLDHLAFAALDVTTQRTARLGEV